MIYFIVEVYMRKYYEGRPYNKHYFDEITTKEQAYILGFMFADASNIPSKNTISIGIMRQDRYLLEKICTEIDLATDAVKDHMANSEFGKYPYSKINLSHKYIYNTLTKLGIVHNRQFKGNLPPVPPELTRALLLGVFDGDGSICLDVRNKVSISVSINQPACDEFITLLRTNGFTNHASVKPDKNIYRVRIQGYKSAIQLANILYKDAPSLYLRRKKTVFDTILSRINSPQDGEAQSG